MLHHDRIVLLLGGGVSILGEVRHLFTFIAGSLGYRDTHCLKLAVKERVAVGKFIRFDILAEEKVAIFVASDVSLPLSQRGHACPHITKLGEILTTHRVQVLLETELD